MTVRNRLSSHFASLATRLLTASCVLASMAAAPAETLFWSGNGTTQGGAGTWNTTDARWGALLAGPYSTVWDNGTNDTAIFGSTAGTVTMGENITTGGITFESTGYTINTGGNTLTLGAADNTILFGGNRFTVGATITGTIASTGNFTLAQRVFPIVSTLTLNSTGDGWSGTTTVEAGSALTLGANNTALINTSAININGGTITINKSGVGANQVSDTAAITFNGGGTYQQTNGSSGPFSETLGAVTVASGQANFNYTNGASSGGVFTQLTSLTRSVNTAAVTFGNANAAQTSFRVSGAADTAADEIIGPWATFGTSVAAQTDYAIYAGSNGTVVGANIAGSAQSTWSTVHAETSNYTLANAAGSVADGVLSATRNISTLRNTPTLGVATANSTTEYFTLAGNSFANGDLITVSGTGGTTAGVPYYVISTGGAGADTFQISTTPGGTAVNLSNTTAGQIAGGLNLNGFNLGTYGILNGTANANSGFAIAGSGSVTLPTTTSGNLFVTTSASVMTIDSVIADNGAGVLTLVKNGSNTLTLRGANTYTGDLVVNAGTVTLSNVGAWGPTGKNVTFAGSGTLNPLGTYTGGVLTVNEGAVGTIGRGVSGSPATTFASTTGSGKLIFQGTGNAAVGLNLGDASSFTGDVQVNISFGTNPRPLVIFSSMNDAVGSALQSGGGQGDSNQGTFFRYQGTSQLTFNNRRIEFLPRSAGNNAVRDMTLENNSANAAHTWVINPDVVNNNDRTNNLGTLILAGTNTGDNELAGQYGDSTYNGQSFRLSKAGNGKWIVSNVANTYSGVTSVTGGTLEVTKLADGGVASSIGTSSNAASNLTLSNGTTLRYTGSGDSTDRGFTIAGTSNGHQTTLNSSGTGALNFTSTATPGYGTTNQTRTLNLRGTNADANTLAAVLANNGTGAVSLIKNDAGTWVLAGDNTYTGVTTINGGTLLINGISSAATGNVVVNAGGTLGGDGIIGGAVTFTGASFLSPGNSPGQLTMPSLSLAALTTTTMELGGTTLGTLYDNITINEDGALGYGGILDVVNFGAFNMDVGSFTYDLFSFSGTTSPTGDFATVTVNSVGLSNDGFGVWTGTNGPDVEYTFTQSTGDLIISVVPEPTTLALLASGVALLGLRLARRRRVTA